MCTKKLFVSCLIIFSSHSINAMKCSDPEAIYTKFTLRYALSKKEQEIISKYKVNDFRWIFSAEQECLYDNKWRNMYVFVTEGNTLEEGDSAKSCIAYQLEKGGFTVNSLSTPGVMLHNKKNYLRLAIDAEKFKEFQEKFPDIKK